MTTTPATFTGPGPTIAEVGEHGIISAITAAAPSRRNGDDAAVLAAPAPNSRTVVATDTLVAGRHFRPDWSSPFDVGRKAIVQNFADIEAMGARAIAAVVALSAPAHTSLDAVTDLAAGMHAKLGEYSAELVGGDITDCDTLVVSVTAIGLLGGDREALSLSRARPGQTLVAHGAIGYSAAGLALLNHHGPDDIPEEFLPLVDAHRAPHLTPGRGLIARATGATAMTDNSDGLIADLSTMAHASSVRIDLDTDAIAPDELLTKAGAHLGCDPWEWVLAGGEDHTLLGTTNHQPPSGFRTIGRVHKQRHTPAVTVGGDTPAYSSGWTTYAPTTP